MNLVKFDRAGPPASNSPPDVQKCTVLLVDDDPDCLAEYAEVLQSLCYACVVAASASEALRQIAEDPRIGIVISDIDMPVMDGITFLDELASRFAPSRPIVPIVVTAFGSLDCAVQAMRFNAVDFLPKPASHEDLAAALRRASSRWMQMARQMQGLEGPSPASEESQQVHQDEAGRPPSRQDLILIIKSIMRRRHRRADFLDPGLFADPSWDILLELALARLEGVAVPVSSACAASQVPYTTALRYLQQLVDAGMLRRWKDPLDNRRVLLEMENRTFDAMISYVTAVSRGSK